MWTRQAWLYLVIVMDLHTRCIVGWAFSMRADMELVIQPIQQAGQRRRPGAGLVSTLIRVAQYMSERDPAHRFRNSRLEFNWKCR
jgi:transposase InsO family protein